MRRQHYYFFDENKCVTFYDQITDLVLSKFLFIVKYLYFTKTVFRIQMIIYFTFVQLFIICIT